MKIDFTHAEDCKHWTILNDDVMGGLSQSRFELTNSAIGIFNGQISLARNGGFTSIRRPLSNESFHTCQGVSIKVKGDGRTYQFRVRMDDEYDGIAYRALFSTLTQQWQTINLPFSAFAASFRGRILPNAPALKPQLIKQIGFLLADKREGSFWLELEWIDSF